MTEFYTYPDTVGSLANPTPTPASDNASTRLSNLESARERKFARLGRAGHGELDRQEDTYADIGGYQESMANKIVNDYSPEELEYISNRIYQEHGVVETPDGLFKHTPEGELTPFQGSLEGYASLYEYGTHDGNVKLGTWGNPDPSSRYSDEVLNHYGTSIGPSGVNREDLRRNRILPRPYAELLESLYHGNIHNLENRAVRYGVDQPLDSYRALRDQYGTGATEIYRPTEAPSLEGYDGSDVWAEFSERFQINPDDPTQVAQESIRDVINRSYANREESRGSSSTGVINRLDNIARSGAMMFTQSLIVDPADWLVERFGGDLGTEEEKREALSNWFNVDTSYTEEAAADVQERIGKMVDDYRSGNGIDLEDFAYIGGRVGSTPEFLSESLGFVLSLGIGGLISGPTKVGKAVNAVERSLKAGRISKPAAIQGIRKIKADASAIDYLTYFGAKNIAPLAVTTGMANNMYDEYVENNAGEGSVGGALQVFATAAAAVALDRFSAGVIMRNTPGLRKFTDPDYVSSFSKLVKSLPAEGYRSIAPKALKGVGYAGVLARDGALEGITEYTQTMLELFGTQYATETYGSDMGEFIRDQERQVEALTGAAIGAVTGPQMRMFNDTVGRTAGMLADRAANSRLQRAVKHLKEQADSIDENTNTAEFADRDALFKGAEEAVARTQAMLAGNASEINFIDVINNKQTIDAYLQTQEGADRNPDTVAVSRRLGDFLLDTIEKNNGELPIEIPVVDTSTNTANPVTTPEDFSERYDFPLEGFNVVDSTSAESIESGLYTLLADGTMLSYADPQLVATIPGNLQASIIQINTGTEGPAEINIGTRDNAQMTQGQGQVLESIIKNLPNEEGTPVVNFNGENSSPDAIVPAGWVKPQVQKIADESAYRKAAAVKVAASIIADRQGNLSDNEELVLNHFAEKQGIQSNLQNILKSFESVETEARYSDIGYTTYEADFDYLKSSGVTDPAPYNSMYKQVTNFWRSTNQSITQLQEGIRAAKAEAQTRTTQGAAVSGGPSSHTVQTAYRKYTQDGSDDFFGINLTRVEEKGKVKWVAHTKEAEALIRAKSTTQANLSTLLNKMAKEGKGLIRDESIIPLESIHIVTPKGKKGNENSRTTTHKARNTIQAAENAMLRLLPNANRQFTKVIADSAAMNSFWKGDQLLSVSGRINVATTNPEATGSYNADDIVYLDISARPKGRHKSPLSDKNNPVRIELEEAIKAGATIVTGHNNSPTTKSYNEIRGVIKTITNSQKDAVAYEALGPNTRGGHAESRIFVPQDRQLQGGVTPTELQERLKSEDSEQKTRTKAREAARKRVVARALAAEAARARLDEAETDSVRETLTTALEEAEASLEAAREAALPFFATTSDAESAAMVEEAVASLPDGTESVPADIEILTEALREKSADARLSRFIERMTRNEIEAAVKAVQQVESTDRVPEGVTNDLYTLVRTVMAEDQARREQATTILGSWRDATRRKLDSSGLLEVLQNIAKELGVKIQKWTKTPDEDTLVLRQQAHEIVDNSVGRHTDQLTYETIVEEKRIVKGNIVTEEVALGIKSTFEAPAGTTYSRENLNGKLEVRHPEGREYTDTEKAAIERDISRAVGSADTGNRSNLLSRKVLRIRTINHNPSKYIKVNRDTPLNTLPADRLPGVFRNILESTRRVFEDAVPSLHPEELKGKGKGKLWGEFKRQIDSPARGLLFDTEGNVHDSSLLAMGVALREFLQRNASLLTEGRKDDEVVAAMFNLAGVENLTEAHHAFARDSGMLRKTVADNLGKAFLRSLGISRDGGAEVSKGHYERLASSIGNHIVHIGIKSGVLESVEHPSNKISKLMNQDADRTTTFSNKAMTSYIRAVEPTSVKPKRRGKPLAEYVELLPMGEMVQEAAILREIYPDFSSVEKTPKVGTPFTDKEVAEAVASVRNDRVGATPPSKAKDVIKAFMKTPYTMNIPAVSSLMEYMDEDPAHKGNILRLLGHIPIDETNPDYIRLTKDQKEVQEAINNKAESDLRFLTEALEYSRREDGTADPLYFAYFYTKGQRYSVDSNTLNPQGVKLHRWLTTPSEQNVTYKFDPKTHTFVYQQMSDKGEVVGEREASYYIRAALAQAFDVSFEKNPTESVINFGNTLLSLDSQQVADLKQEFFETGLISLITASSDGPKSYKMEDFGQALAAITFLEAYAQAKETDGTTTIQSPLTLETDVVTSGYSNKIQQVGALLIQGMTDDPRGLLDEQTQRIAVVDMKQVMDDMITDVNIDPKDPNISMHKIKELLNVMDSYQNLGVESMSKLTEIVGAFDVQNPVYANIRNDIFTALPGTDLFQHLSNNPDERTAGVLKDLVSSTLRNLFKNPFMIFNYAAGVSRITTNLSYNLADSLLESVAGLTDTEINGFKKDTESPVLKAAFRMSTVLKSTSRMTDPKKALRELRRAVREDRSSLLKTVMKDGTKQLDLKTFIAEQIIKPTYGEAVSEVFKSDVFQPLIRLQDLTNDAFKGSFMVFQKAYLARLRQLQAEGLGDTIFTAEMEAKIFNELRSVFPQIISPLAVGEEGTGSSGVHIYGENSRTPSPSTATVTSPQDRLTGLTGVTGKGNATKKVNILISQIEAAISAGAVTTLHAIDGAQMNGTILSLMDQFGYDKKDVGVPWLTIHDAILGVLPLVDDTVYTFNKETVELHSRYNMVDEILKTIERVEAALNATPDNPAGAVMVGGQPLFLNSQGMELHKSWSTTLKGMNSEVYEKVHGKNGLMRQLEAAKAKREQDKKALTKVNGDPDGHKKRAESLSLTEDRIASLEKDIDRIKKNELSFENLFGQVKAQLQNMQAIIHEAKREGNGPTREGAIVNVMSGLPGGMTEVIKDPNGPEGSLTTKPLIEDREAFYLGLRDQYHNVESVETVPRPIEASSDDPTVGINGKASVDTKGKFKVTMESGSADKVRSVELTKMKMVDDSVVDTIADKMIEGRLSLLVPAEHRNLKDRENIESFLSRIEANARGFEVVESGKYFQVNHVAPAEAESPATETEPTNPDVDVVNKAQDTSLEEELRAIHKRLAELCSTPK